METNEKRSGVDRRTGSDRRTSEELSGWVFTHSKNLRLGERRVEKRRKADAHFFSEPIVVSSIARTLDLSKESLQ